MSEVVPARDAASGIALNAARSESAVSALTYTRSPGDLATAQHYQDLLHRATAALAKTPLRHSDDSYLSSQVQQSASRLQSQIQDLERIATGRSADAAGNLIDRYLHVSAGEAGELAARLKDRLDLRTNDIRAQFVQRDDQLARSLLWAFGLASLIGILLAIFCVRLITEPIGRLSLAARAVKRVITGWRRNSIPGCLKRSGEAPITRSCSLGRAFAHMAEGLEERETRLLSQAERLLAANTQLEGLQSLTDVALADLPADELLELLLQRVITGVGGASRRGLPHRSGERTASAPRRAKRCAGRREPAYARTGAPGGGRGEVGRLRAGAGRSGSTTVWCRPMLRPTWPRRSGCVAKSSVRRRWSSTSRRRSAPPS